MREVIVRFENQNGDPAYVVGEPVADIVRCKECFFYDKDGYNDEWGWCRQNDSDWRDNDFCSWGKKGGKA